MNAVATGIGENNALLIYLPNNKAKTMAGIVAMMTFTAKRCDALLEAIPVTTPMSF